MRVRILWSLAAAAGLVLSLTGLVNVAGAPSYPPFADPAFAGVWQRTDSLVAAGEVPRSWYWGPHPDTTGLYETLTDAPDGSGRRLVQYFDKSRMELNNRSADPASPFYVTNGLLTVELIGGCIQTSTQSPCGEVHYPAVIPMSGDPGDQLAPTYAAFGKVANSRFGDHPAPDRRGQKVNQSIDRNGDVHELPPMPPTRRALLVYYDPRTRHNIPEQFWNFVNARGAVREGDHIAIAPLSTPWYYVTGLPISEAYWARATIQGHDTLMMIQAFERRVLTYVPSYAPAWQVEMGNIGQHYYDWRYKDAGHPGPGFGTPPATSTTTPAGGTPTVTPAGMTPTAMPSATATTRPTGTGTATPVPSATATPPSTATVRATPTSTATATPHP